MQPGKKNSTRENIEKATEAEKPDSQNQPDVVAAAHEEAIHDIEEDPDFSMQSPNDDLDEGETARLGEDKTDLV